MGELAERTVQYRRPDGTLSASRSDAILVTPVQVLTAINDACAALRFIGCAEAYELPQSYWLGTAQHESGFAVNELDTETDGFQSYGLFQVSKDEARAMRLADVDLLTLDGNAQVMVRLADRARRALRLAAGIDFNDEPDPHDLPAYLAIAHNLGLWGGTIAGQHVGAVVSVLQHGLLWSSASPQGYKQRNPTLRVVSSGYGDDCLTAHV